MNSTINFDVTGFIKKMNTIDGHIAPDTDKAVRDVAMNVLNQAVKNLSGNHHKGYINCGNAGKLPVHVVTGTLRRSMQIAKIEEAHWAVFSDERIANYNKFVHDGTIKTGEKGQPFLGDAVKKEKDKGQKEMGSSVVKIITNENLKEV